MVQHPDGMNAFEFSVLSGLRAPHRGCTPRVPPPEQVAVTAQHDVARRTIFTSSETVQSRSESVG